MINGRYSRAGVWHIDKRKGEMNIQDPRGATFQLISEEQMTKKCLFAKMMVSKLELVGGRHIYGKIKGEFIIQDPSKTGKIHQKVDHRFLQPKHQVQ